MKKPKSNVPASLDIQEGQDVFISYSRADQEWVRWLSGQFVSAGRQPWVDWQGIKPGEKWWPAILQGIDAANAFVFVLSPDSVQSTVCKQEIDRAVESGKRIVPLVCRDISGLEIHPELRERNYIFLRTEEERSENLSKLFDALDTDLEHVRAHSRFGVRAREWEAKGKSSAFLLRGGALEDAIQWQSRAPGKLPVPTALQTEHIQASRKAARSRQRLTTGAITGGLLVALGLALVAMGQRNAATAARNRAEEQTTEARIQAGKGQILRGELLPPTSSDRAFYNARAVGFAGLGKLHPTARDSDDRWTTSIWFALREVSLDIQKSWKLLSGGKAIIPAPEDEDEFPILFAGKEAAEEAAKAYHAIAMAEALPFLWTAPVASQHSNSIWSVAWSPDGQTLASGSEDKTIKLWDATTGKEKATLAGHSGAVRSVAWSPDGQTLASGSDDSIKLWDVESGNERATLAGRSIMVRSLAWSPDGQTLASGSRGPSSMSESIKLWEVASGKEKATLAGHSGTVSSVAWSPDGQTLASGAADGIVKLWEVGTGKESATLAGHSGPVLGVAWSPDGQTLASGSRDNCIKLWDMTSRREKAILTGHSFGVRSVAWSPDGHTLASGSLDNSIKLWEVETGKEKATLAGHSGPVSSVAWSPDGQTLASGSWDNHIKLWDAGSGNEKATQAGHSRSVRSVAWSLDGQTLASGSDDHRIKLWDVASGKEKATLVGHSGIVTSVAWSPNGQSLASGSVSDHEGFPDNSIKLWDMASDKEKATLAGHSSPVSSVAWSPDGQTMASGSGDNSIKLWDVTTGKEKATLAGHSDSVNSVSWSPDGQTLASGSGDNSIKLWGVASGKEKSILPLHSTTLWSIAWSPDSHTLASGVGDEIVKLWDAGTGEEKATLAGHSGPVRGLAWSPDGHTLVSCSGDPWSELSILSEKDGIKLWDVASGQEKATLAWHSGSVSSVAWSPDSQTLAIGSDANSIKLLDAGTGQEKAILAGHSDSVTSVSWSPDGQTLASGSEDKSIKLWDVATGKEKATLAGHSDYVTSVAWSPDGQTLASGSNDNSIKLWNSGTGMEKATLAEHSGSVLSLGWSPDGQTLASGSEDNSIKLWDSETGQEKATLAGHSGKVWRVAWSPDGQTLASGSEDNSIKLWEVATVIVRTDLYVYVKEGWCDFDPKTENLQWNEPKRELYRSIETPFRNVPQWSALGIRQREDVEAGEKNWLLYLEVLQAENWTAFPFFSQRLTVEQKQRPHAAVVWAGRTAAEQAVQALNAGNPWLAAQRLATAQAIVAALPESRREEVFISFGTAVADGPGLPETWAWLREFVAPENLRVVRRAACNRIFAGLPQGNGVFGEVQARVTLVREWTEKGAPWFADLSPETVARLAILIMAFSSDEAGAKSMVTELIPRLEADLPVLKSKVLRAHILRMLAGARTGTAALATWRELLATEFADHWDVKAAGALAAELKDEKTCREIFLAGLPRFPKATGWLNYEFGGTLRSLHADKEALPYFRAARANPAGLKVSHSFYGLANLLDHLGQTDETWKVFQELVAHDGAIVDHIASAGYFAAKQGFPEAREIFAKAEAKAEGVEEKDQVRRQEGWALINLGDNGTALANFEMSRVAAEADPNDGLVVNGSLLRGLAIACHLNGETEAAKSHYRALIAMEPEWAAAKTIADLSSSDWPQKERVPLEAVRKAVMGSSPPPAQKL